MPNYVPGDKPTVPGHETVIRIVKVGAGVTRHKVGERYLVQTDYRWLPTASSNAAFGYNFEGALQEYVLLDERVIISPDGESMLIPVPEDLSASALALCEPWACVEDAYVEKQRRLPKDGGRMLVVGEEPVERSRLGDLLARPRETVFTTADAIAELEDAAFDDVIYFGADAATRREALPEGRRRRAVQHRPVRRQVRPPGRVAGRPRSLRRHPRDRHDRRRPGGGHDAIPATAEIRPGDKINIIGAAGPDGHDARHPRPLPGRARRHRLRRRPERRAAGRPCGDGRAAGPRRTASPCGSTIRPRTSSRQFDYIVLMAPVAGAGRAGGSERGTRGDHQHLRRHPRRDERRRSTSTPTSRSSSTSSAPAARCSRT